MMISCKSTVFLEAVNLTMPKNLSMGLLLKASTKQTRIDIWKWSALSLDSSASIVKSPATIKLVMV